MPHRDLLVPFALQVRRALPDHRLIEIDVTHPIFQVFFGMKKPDFPHPLVRVESSYWGMGQVDQATDTRLNRQVALMCKDSDPGGQNGNSDYRGKL